MPVALAIGGPDPVVRVEGDRRREGLALTGDRAREVPPAGLRDLDRALDDELHGLRLALGGEAELLHGERLARELAGPVDVLREVVDRAARLRPGAEGAQDDRPVEHELACEVVRLCEPALLQGVEDAELRRLVHGLARREEVELALRRPVVRRPAREAERERHAAQVRHPERRHALPEEVDLKLPRDRDQALEDQDPAAAPGADLRRLGARVDGARARDLELPGLEDGLDRLARREVPAERARPLPLLLAAEDEAEVVHVHGVELEAERGEAHGRAHLEEAAHPRVREVDLDLLVVLLVRRLDAEARRVDRQGRRLVGADLLELVVERGRVVDVRRAAGELAHVLEVVVARSEPAVARLVLREALEEDLVRVDGDHGVEDEPEVLVDLVEPLEVALLRREEGRRALTEALVEVPELLLEPRHLALDLRAPRERRDELLVLVLGEPRLVGALVLGLEAEIRDDHVVERAHGLAEGRPEPELPREVRGLPLQVRRETHGARVGAARHGRARGVGVAKLHRAPRPGPGRAGPRSPETSS